MTEIQNTLNGEASILAAVPVLVLQPLPNHVPSDALVIEQICQRHEQALGLLYDRYSRLLYTIALRITGDRSIAEEVIQDVFNAVWQSARGFHSDGNVKAWLIGIARHRAIDATGTRHFRMQNAVVTLDEYHHVSAANETETQVIDVLDREQVQRALSDLPPLQRTAIELAYYAGCTGAEIAARTGVPIGTVKTRLRLGIARLRGLLFTNPRTDNAPD
ncbi:MAG: RNA polymerase sigma factor [Roseiflexaceae bacterium]